MGLFNAPSPNSLLSARFQHRGLDTHTSGSSGFTTHASSPDLTSRQVGGWLRRSSSMRPQLLDALTNASLRSPLSTPGTAKITITSGQTTTHHNLAQHIPPQFRFHPDYGYGMVDAAAAVHRALSSDRLFSQSGPDRSTLRLGDRPLWGLNHINVNPAWSQGYTGDGVVVAVLDTGVDYTHSDLAKNIWRNPGEIPGNGRDDDGNGFVDDVRGWNFVDNTNAPIDRIDGHGTHVAGTIAARRNGYGVTGVAPHAKIMPVKVLSDAGTGSNGAIARGIRYAADNGADVINMSLGGGYSRQVERAVRYAVQQGSVVVMAAGNDGASSPLYPGALANRWGITVGAIDNHLNMADFSNRAGSLMDYIVAPGVNIVSTFPGERYKSLDGTSMAAPHVAGVVALMLSANPDLQPAQVERILTDTANRAALS